MSSREYNAWFWGLLIGGFVSAALGAYFTAGTACICLIILIGWART